ncbi:hypothetical protein LPB072_19655 [Hydrogenophaga crassostreae]|nr:hypothetical protein LPB072_19655 [Hydrogenophaga crassostreae]
MASPRRCGRAMQIVYAARGGPFPVVAANRGLTSDWVHECHHHRPHASPGTASQMKRIEAASRTQHSAQPFCVVALRCQVVGLVACLFLSVLNLHWCWMLSLT